MNDCYSNRLQQSQITSLVCDPLRSSLVLMKIAFLDQSLLSPPTTFLSCSHQKRFRQPADKTSVFKPQVLGSAVVRNTCFLPNFTRRSNLKRGRLVGYLSLLGAILLSMQWITDLAVWGERSLSLAIARAKLIWEER